MSTSRFASNASPASGGTRAASRRLRPRLPRVSDTGPQRALFADGLLGSASDAVMQFLPVYLVALGATAGQVGLLSSASGLAGLVALAPGAWLARRPQQRKAIVLLGQGGIARAGLLLAALVPLVVGGNAAVLALIALGGARSLVSVLSQPAWTAVFAAVVPDDMRGRYTAARSLGTSIAAMAMAPLLGWMIEAYDGISGFQYAFALAAGVGLIASGAYARIRVPAEEAEARPAPDPSADARIERERPRWSLAAFGDAPFRRFIVATAALQVASMMAGPFFFVYLVNSLDATAAEIGALALLTPASAVLGQVIAGVLVARAGARRALAIVMVTSPVMPLLWLMIHEPWQAAIPNLLSGISWSIFHLATFNMLLQFGGRDSLPRFSAAFQGTGMLAAFVGPLLGTALVGFVGLPLVFMLSAVGRVAALAVFFAPAVVIAARPAIRAVARARQRRHSIALATLHPLNAAASMHGIATGIGSRGEVMVGDGGLEPPTFRV